MSFENRGRIDAVAVHSGDKVVRGESAHLGGRDWYLHAMPTLLEQVAVDAEACYRGRRE